MPILRYEPGGRAPATAMYALVGHFGESTDFAVWCNEGERLPLVTVAVDNGALWYVRVDVANEGARVA